MSTRQALAGEHLSPTCGHHCGLRSTADEGKRAFIGHCPCDECRCRYALIEVVIDPDQPEGTITLVDRIAHPWVPERGVPMCDSWGTMGVCTPVSG